MAQIVRKGDAYLFFMLYRAIQGGRRHDHVRRDRNPVKRFRLIILLLIGCIGLLLGLLVVQRRLMGLQMYLPPRLLVLSILGDLILIGIIFWQIRRIKNKGIESCPVSIDNRFLNDIIKAIGIYAAIETSVCGVVLLVAAVTWETMLRGYLLFLIPGLVGFPLIMNARRFTDRPKSGSFRFALAMGLFFLLILIAVVYSGLESWIGIPSGGGGVIFNALFLAFISACVYYSTYKHLTLRKLEEKADKLPNQPTHNTR